MAAAVASDGPGSSLPSSERYFSAQQHDMHYLPGRADPFELGMTQGDRKKCINCATLWQETPCTHSALCKDASVEG